MDRIRIEKSETADTRTARHKVTKEELLASSRQHIDDVCRISAALAKELQRRGLRHDWTKIEYIDEFYRQFSRAQDTGRWGTGWYDCIHVKKERHHLADVVPDDVNLLDVLEYIIDGIAAGIGRSGHYKPVSIPSELLVKAAKNTEKLILDHIDGDTDG